MASRRSVTDLQTADPLPLGLEHFDLWGLAALSKTSKCCHARVQAALQAAAPAAAQQVLLRAARDQTSRVPPVEVLKPLMERAVSMADGAAVEGFASTLATRVVSRPKIFEAQARVWLFSGLQLSDAVVYAAARCPSAQPALWVRCLRKMLPSSADLPISPMLQALCHKEVSFEW
jgi:hypothetical protein